MPLKPLVTFSKMFNITKFTVLSTQQGFLWQDYYCQQCKNYLMSMNSSVCQSVNVRELGLEFYMRF